MNDSDARQRRILGQVAEIKRLSSAVDHALQGRTPASVLITSTAGGEGKSLLAAALATTMATLGRRRTALLDGNWYRPAVHRYFDRERLQSLEDLMRADIEALMVEGGDQAPDLLLAPLHHEDRSEPNEAVFGLVERLIERAANAYDRVIVDGAAIFPTNRMMIDPVMLATRVDGVVLVVQAGVTPKQDVKRACTILRAAGANILGVTVNRHRIPIIER